TSAIIWVSGAKGGFDGPADGLSGVLAEELVNVGISSLRVDYRVPGNLPDSTMDTLAAISYLKSVGFKSIVLVGYSFGGAVAITAAPFSPLCSGVVAISCQTFEAVNASWVSPRSLLLLHGQIDTRLPASCSERIFSWAEEPKELIILPGGDHSLRSCRKEVYGYLNSWLLSHFKREI
ncbi:alpha/beta hydrolase, partial [SAR202 cluster bacterium AD-802-E10_MRT_200m]|nr:alpha/beta hydrolase [SAR202 cluster bacterium AD-802-E10_MRT_200m]